MDDIVTVASTGPLLSLKSFFSVYMMAYNTSFMYSICCSLITWFKSNT